MSTKAAPTVSKLPSEAPPRKRRLVKSNEENNNNNSAASFRPLCPLEVMRASAGNGNGSAGTGHLFGITHEALEKAAQTARQVESDEIRRAALALASLGGPGGFAAFSSPGGKAAVGAPAYGVSLGGPSALDSASASASREYFEDTENGRIIVNSSGNQLRAITENDMEKINKGEITQFRSGRSTAGLGYGTAPSAFSAVDPSLTETSSRAGWGVNDPPTPTYKQQILANGSGRWIVLDQYFQQMSDLNARTLNRDTWDGLLTLRGGRRRKTHKRRHHKKRTHKQKHKRKH